MVRYQWYDGTVIWYQWHGDLIVLNRELIKYFTKNTGMIFEEVLGPCHLTDGM